MVPAPASMQMVVRNAENCCSSQQEVQRAVLRLEQEPDERLVNETTTRKTRREIGQRNDPDESTTFDHSGNCGGEARTRKATQSPPTARFLMSFVPRKNTKGSKQELSKKLNCTRITQVRRQRLIKSRAEGKLVVPDLSFRDEQS